MSKLKKLIFWGFFAIVNLFVLLFLAGTNRLATNDEARQLSAGVSHWRDGDFRPGNDSPPLARMVAVLPSLPLNVKAVPGASGAVQSAEVADVRDRELNRAGEFAHLNPEPFHLIVLARLTGFAWWLLGGWIIFRWSDRLHGGRAGDLGVILWSSCPIVLGYEQLATPGLPSAVACLAATHAFRGYFILPGWDKALLAGLLLGVALLADFASLALLVILPPLGVLYRWRRGEGPAPPLGLRGRVFRVALVIGLAGYVVNLGYRFDRSGLRLDTFDFASHALASSPRPDRELPSGTATGNRFRGSWLGRVIMPLPVEYLRGLDRRWHEWEVPLGRDDEDAWAFEVGLRSPSRVGGDLPFSLRVVLLGCLILAAIRRRGRPSPAEELTLWVPALVFAAISDRAVGLPPPSTGTLLAIPFAIIIASRVAVGWSSGRRSIRWMAIALSAWCVGDCVMATRGRFFTPNRTTRFRQDLVRQGRKLGLNVPEPRLSTGSGAEERGFIYRTFLDSKGGRVDYALFVPESYRGDRPFPLILFLHGWGDRKKSPTDRMYAEVGLPFTLKYRSIDFLVLIPQGLSGYWQADGDDARKALELLDAIQGRYRVDPKRISLTGLSSGGSGAWALAARDPGRWSAIAPVAGSCEPELAPSVRHIPCWCFHDRYDKTTPVEGPRGMVAALGRLGGTPLYTEYSDTNHNAGERAYILPDLYDWLSCQRLP